MSSVGAQAQQALASEQAELALELLLSGLQPCGRPSRIVGTRSIAAHEEHRFGVFGVVVALVPTGEGWSPFLLGTDG